MGALVLANSVYSVSGSSYDSDTHSQTDAQKHILELGVAQEDVIMNPEVGCACNDGDSKDQHKESSHSSETLDQFSHFTVYNSIINSEPTSELVLTPFSHKSTKFSNTHSRHLVEP